MTLSLGHVFGLEGKVALVTGGGSLKTFLKNLTHARHAGFRPMLQVRCCRLCQLPQIGVRRQPMPKQRPNAGL